MSTKTTLLLAPALAPLTGSDPLACAVRDLAKALQENGWAVTVAIGIDATDESSQAGLRRAGLARRLEPLTATGQELIVSEGSVGDMKVVALTFAGSPDATSTLEATRALGEDPALIQLWGPTASALSSCAPAKTLVHHADAKSAKGLEAADLVLMQSKTDAKAALKIKDSPFAPLSAKLRGLAPGFDAREWNPSRDSLLAERMDPPTAAIKAAAKAALRIELGLKDVDVPLIAVVSTIEKLPRALGAELIKLPVQIAGLGAGKHIEALASRAPQVAACPKPLSDFETRQLRHRIVAAADFVLLAPGANPTSQLFPCQYGTAVIAHNSGEAGDRIVNFDLNSRTGSGFLYRNQDELMATICNAIQAWEAGEETRDALIQRCLHLDLSWQTAALRFDELVAPIL
jgi:glycogen synthase